MFPFDMASRLKTWKKPWKKYPTRNPNESLVLPPTISVHNYATRQRYLTLLRKVERLGKTTTSSDAAASGYEVLEHFLSTSKRREWQSAYSTRQSETQQPSTLRRRREQS